jgi:hypothetical protein
MDIPLHVHAPGPPLLGGRTGSRKTRTPHMHTQGSSGCVRAVASRMCDGQVHKAGEQRCRWYSASEAVQHIARWSRWPVPVSRHGRFLNAPAHRKSELKMWHTHTPSLRGWRGWRTRQLLLRFCLASATHHPQMNSLFSPYLPLHHTRTRTRQFTSLLAAPPDKTQFRFLQLLLHLTTSLFFSSRPTARRHKSCP